jgi:GNAT superfamily N-acetyltransferase
MTPPDRVTVRQAEPKDAHAAAEVLRRSITELCVADHRGDLDTIEKWLANKTPQNILAWLANDDNFCVVADENDRLAGIGLLHREGEIRLCYLAPGEQRRGIGKAIYLALEAKAKAWGVHKLRLESTVAARSFYERLGYRAAGAARPGFGVSHCHPYEKTLQGEYQITLETSDIERASKEILAEVLRYNASQAGPLNDARYVLTVRSADQRLIGGLVAMQYWNGMFIELLWVAEEMRRRGLGTQLMRRAESDLATRGGEIVFLSTWSFQAPAFYERLGYSAFGKLEGMPPGATRTWYYKRLRSDVG